MFIKNSRERRLQIRRRYAATGLVVDGYRELQDMLIVLSDLEQGTTMSKLGIIEIHVAL